MALYNFRYVLLLTLLFSFVTLIHCAKSADKSPIGERDVTKKENQNKTDIPKSTTTSKVSTKVVGTTTTTVTPPKTNCTTNGTNCNSHDNEGLLGSTYKKIQENKEMLMRTFYVLLGVTGVVVLYFVVKALRIRRRKSRTRRYGLLAGKGDKMEMTPLDQDDDDDEEDITVFEMNGKRR